ncbi:MAG: shikimate dehydrogenase [Nitrospiraceae bacterium]|nr:shikimate dehydrogenase [Nitrospiraceae bacterium]
MTAIRNITGSTQTTGIFGYPVAHTLSPFMHNAAFRELGLDFCYVPFLVEPDMLAAAVAGLRAMHIRGVNITLPHKENITAMLDLVDQEAHHIGAVNTIVNDNGTLKGFNTDGRGFMMSLSEAGVDVSGKRVLMLGAGGAARAVGYSLCKEASSVYIAARTASRAAGLCSHLGSINANVECIGLKESGSDKFLSGIDVIINATPLGLEQDDPLPIAADAINSRHVVCDLIYKMTPFLKAAAQKGARTIDGSGMLLWQGVLCFELWTGRKAPVDVMRLALNSKLSVK